MIEAHSGLVLASTSFNKLCSKNCNKGQCGPQCSINWAPHVSMGSSEREAVSCNLEAVGKAGLQVKAVVCDGNAKEVISKIY